VPRPARRRTPVLKSHKSSRKALHHRYLLGLGRTANRYITQLFSKTRASLPNVGRMEQRNWIYNLLEDASRAGSCATPHATTHKPPIPKGTRSARTAKRRETHGRKDEELAPSCNERTVGPMRFLNIVDGTLTGTDYAVTIMVEQELERRDMQQQDERKASSGWYRITKQWPVQYNQSNLLPSSQCEHGSARALL
jgi:hypothetical protein